jgi:hypothetical protein
MAFTQGEAMLLKPIEIQIDPCNPFLKDSFERKAVVESMVRLIEHLNGPFVIAIDSPWGTGKTTFLKMLRAQLEREKFACLHFNAWETDFAEDPLIAFMGEMDQLIKSISPNEATRQESLDAAKRIAGTVAKRAIPAAIKVVTMGALDLTQEFERAIAEATGSLSIDAVEHYLKEKELIEEFHNQINLVLAIAKDHGKNLPVVIFVDELDRCRPTYAIKLLERIKHLFNVENAIFILALDKIQLSISIGAVYGNEFDSREYLRRFFDLDLKLATVENEKYCDSLIERMNLDELFSLRISQSGSEEVAELKKTFRVMSKLFGFTPRTQEHYMSLLTIAMLATADTQELHPIELAIMAAIKLGAEEIYDNVAIKKKSVVEISNFLKDRFIPIFGEQYWAVIYGHILNMRMKNDKAANDIIKGIFDEFRHASDFSQKHANNGTILDIANSNRRLAKLLEIIVKRIDIAAQFSTVEF